MAACSLPTIRSSLSNAHRSAPSAVASTSGASATRNVRSAQRSTTHLRSQADGVNVPAQNTNAAVTSASVSQSGSDLDGTGQPLGTLSPSNAAALAFFMSGRGARGPPKQGQQQSPPINAQAGSSDVSSSSTDDTPGPTETNAGSAERSRASQAPKLTPSTRVKAKTPVSKGKEPQAQSADSGSQPTRTKVASTASSNTSGRGDANPSLTRVQQIKEALFSSMRAQVETPSAQNISLVFSPLTATPGTANAGAPPPAAPTTSGSEVLRVDPRASQQLQAAMQAEELRQRARAGAAAAVGEGMRLRRRTATAATAPLDKEPSGRGDRDGRQPRLLKPKAVRAAEAAVRRREEEAAARQRYEAPAAGMRRDEETSTWRREEAPAAGWRREEGRRLEEAPAAGRRREEAVDVRRRDEPPAVVRRREQFAARASEVATMQRRRGVQRANEEFAAYVEGMAAAVAAGGLVKGRQQRQQQPRERDERKREEEEQRKQQEQQQMLRLQQQQREREEEELWMQRQRQEQQEEQATLLRGLASMFRNFARQAPPATAAAAAAAGFFTPLAASAAGAKSRDGSTRERNTSASSPSPFSFMRLPKASDVKLILQPLKREHNDANDANPDGGRPSTSSPSASESTAEADAEAAAAGSKAQGELRARPLPTRDDLLRLLRPIRKASLPPVMRRKGLRLISSSSPSAAAVRPRRQRLLALSLASAQASGILGPDGQPLQTWPEATEMRALRRRAYYFRVLLARRKAAEAAAAEETEETEAAGGAAAGALDAASGQQQEQQQEGKVAAVVGEEKEKLHQTQQTQQQQQQIRVLRPRYSLSDRSFRIRRKLQYSDRMKRVVRKAGFASGAIVPGTAAAVGAAAAGAAAAGKRGATEEALAAKEEEEEDDLQAVVVSEEEGDEGEEADPRGEYNSAAEVTNDVYEQVMGVRLPERAMYGRRAEALSALTPQQVQEQCRAWVEACGREYSLAFHAREPLLLAQPPQSLLLSLEHISRLLPDLAPEQCVAAALRKPALIGLPYDQLYGTVEAVSEALEVGMQEAAKIVMRCPMLAVRETSFPVSQRVALLGALLPVSREKLRQVLRQRPLLLTKSLQNLAGFMMSASTELNLPLFDVALMIAGAPGVTGVAAPRLAARWRLLQSAARRLPRWRRQLASLAPPALGRCLVASEAALGRLEVVASRRLGHLPEFHKFKRVLTMSATRFDAALAAGAAAAAAKAVAVAAAEGAAATEEGATAEEGVTSEDREEKAGSGGVGGGLTAAEAAAPAAASAEVAEAAEAKVEAQEATIPAFVNAQAS
ncbi:hypothetical protein Agub_g10837 [Astrephomene gubernaculifera]|uniref:Uncharacterized protein n=1 Tax=Astrephomene gubernaculifera TaxID=47775 RepID=A0AAD3HQA4_9CHLO|nr:hypothetical protein Agub_g10837 [Astrephomene gubernaculifera]